MPEPQPGADRLADGGDPLPGRQQDPVVTAGSVDLPVPPPHDPVDTAAPADEPTPVTQGDLAHPAGEDSPPTPPVDATTGPERPTLAEPPTPTGPTTAPESTSPTGSSHPPEPAAPDEQTNPDEPADPDEQTSPPEPVGPDAQSRPVEAAAPARGVAPGPVTPARGVAPGPAAPARGSAAVPAGNTPPEPPTPGRPDPTRLDPHPDAPHPDAPRPDATRLEQRPDATLEEPAVPRWSGSAAVPAPPPRRRGWGESVEFSPVPPPPPPPLPPELPEHRAPVDPWAGADTGGWDLHHPELAPPPYPASPPTRPYPPVADPTPPQRAHATPPAPSTPPYQHTPTPPAPPYQQTPTPPTPPAPSTPHPHSPAPAYPSASSAGPASPSPTRPYPVAPVPAARPASPPPARPALPPPPPPAPPRPPKQRRVRPQPVAPPPNPASPPKGYVRRKRRRWPWVLLLSLACCCGCPAWFGKPVWQQYPADAALPAQVADLTLRDDSGSEVDKLKTEARKANMLAEDVYAGVYITSDGKRVAVFGDTGFRFRPESDADDAMVQLTGTYKLGTPQPVDSGVRGRYERCATGVSDGADVVVCTSVDHGSSATGVFTRLSVDDSAQLLARMRAQIVTPKQG
ncbi:hypothetical protein GA0070216_101737 [Micromonospora matsumotoense]|uniref:Uncharacterized protein n=2 Tax=Micromonospora matsumotoense TaxID=121616 RepID=A0A1C4UTQ1_9ACTN|nr:hypothetical protein GA0070216_101737 [Micromonospora matsumotoense]